MKASFLRIKLSFQGIELSVSEIKAQFQVLDTTKIGFLAG